MFRKKTAETHTHREVSFPWAEDISVLTMKPVGMFIASHRDECEECTHKYAREALQHPDEISAFLGSAYAWALRQTKATSADLIQPPEDEDEDGEPLFREAAAALLRLGAAGQIAEMLIWGREAPTSVRVDVLNDAGTAYGLEKAALWTSSPEATPPPWVSTLGPALAYVDRVDQEDKHQSHPEEAPEPENSPSAPPPSSAPSGPPLVLGDRIARRFATAGDPAPLWRRAGAWVLVRLERLATPRAFPPPPGCGPGEGVPHRTTSPPPSTGPPRTTSSPAPPQDEDEDGMDVPMGVVHADPGVSLKQLQADIGDPHQGQAPTTKAALRALLWDHSGDTAAVREAWKATHGGTPPPSDLYRHAKQWATDIAASLVHHGIHPAEVPATMDTLGFHRTRAMDTAVSEWVDQHTTVTPLRRTG